MGVMEVMRVGSVQRYCLADFASCPTHRTFAHHAMP